MSTRIYLWRALFGEKPRILLENSDFTVTSFRYDSKRQRSTVLTLIYW